MAVVQPVADAVCGAGRRPVAGLLAALVAVNMAAWAWTLWMLGTSPVLLGAAGLAWTFGLRHGMDADHIAAIDTVTRKLMLAGRSPVWVGVFFSLGHSSVVILATAMLVLLPMHGWLERWHLIGGTLGTVVSAMFLFAMVAANIGTATGQWRALCRGDAATAPPVPEMAGGPLAWLFRPVFRLIGRSWQMYPLGFLFGLGFDTATEIGLLGMAAAQAAHGLGLPGVMSFPLLFTAGMALVDTLDAVLMYRAYGWSAGSGRRRLAYNLAITLISIVTAGAVGGIELAQKVGELGGWDGPVSRALAVLGAHFPALGVVIVSMFVLLWAGAAFINRTARPVTSRPAASRLTPRL
ncbi:HoxN/HupN/NixA family nickel/cobalt transporter [Komagataeibacter melaceti]|uniref:Nickel/cobalt efflux system n=1 Tax=Komagataeibacter melaceti TaxID=2766577 RepID=A0A371Z4D5_9PROT|nr:HoxN/HupN/NixA family nickel/cobalt transporter [Komagataeibacter melaceti]RFD21345.1 HoxN/HupN/NixA family nickel/cobalt transporter [Komagataeibacter melaceti]